MTTGRGEPIQRGHGRALGAIVLAAATASMIVVPTWTDEVIAARLAILGLTLIVVALALGSNRLIGLASIPMLGSAAIASAVADDPDWIRTIAVGCLWYVAVELAWDSVEQREDGARGRSLDRRRINELATVVTVALVIAIVGASASGFSRPRTLLVQAPIVLSLFVAIGAATALLARSAPEGR